jgi:hypothetical protein
MARHAMRTAPLYRITIGGDMAITFQEITEEIEALDKEFFRNCLAHKEQAQFPANTACYQSDPSLLFKALLGELIFCDEHVRELFKIHVVEKREPDLADLLANTEATAIGQRILFNMGKEGAEALRVAINLSFLYKMENEGRAAICADPDYVPEEQASEEYFAVNP